MAMVIGSLMGIVALYLAWGTEHAALALEGKRRDAADVRLSTRASMYVYADAGLGHTEEMPSPRVHSSTGRGDVLSLVSVARPGMPRAAPYSRPSRVAGSEQPAASWLPACNSSMEPGFRALVAVDTVAAERTGRSSLRQSMHAQGPN